MKSVSIVVKSSSKEDRVRKYLSTLYSFHKLTEKEIDILVEYVLRYYDVITKYPAHDLELINRMTFNPDVSKAIRAKFGIKVSVFQNYMTKLRKKKVITDKGLNPSYVPPLQPIEIKFIFE